MDTTLRDCLTNGSENYTPWGNNMLMVRCPECGDEHVHYEAPTMVPSDNYTAWEGRGNALYIPMWCEQGHKWCWLLGHHKGITIAGMLPQLPDLHTTVSVWSYTEQELPAPLVATYQQ